MASDELMAMLRLIGQADGRSDPLDSNDVGRRLGWSESATALSLAEARAQLLIWGIRIGGTPAPRFEQIELTVQGRRLLLTEGTAASDNLSMTRGLRAAGPGEP